MRNGRGGSHCVSRGTSLSDVCASGARGPKGAASQQQAARNVRRQAGGSRCAEVLGNRASPLRAGTDRAAGKGREMPGPTGSGRCSTLRSGPPHTCINIRVLPAGCLNRFNPVCQTNAMCRTGACHLMRCGRIRTHPMPARLRFWTPTRKLLPPRDIFCTIKSRLESFQRA